MGKKKKNKVDVSIQNGTIVYGDTEPNSEARNRAIAHMLSYTGRNAIEGYAKGKRPELDNEKKLRAIKVKKLKQSKLKTEEVIIDYLISEQFATDEYSAISILNHMSEEWLDNILENI